MTNKKTDLSGTSTGYKVFAVVILVLITLFFLFPLYWIVTGSFKDAIEINAREPIWFPRTRPSTTMRGCLSTPPSCGCSTSCLSPPWP